MNQSFSKIWIILILAIFVAGGIFVWQYFGTLRKTNWQIYKNEKYKYEVKYPKNWRLATSVMEYIREEVSQVNPSAEIEDWVMITNLSEEEEREYLEALKSYEGIGSAIDHVENADGRAIMIYPTTNKIEEMKEKKVPGWEFSNFRETKIKSGLTVIQFRERITWEMDRDFEMAYIPYPKVLRGGKITYIALGIERNDGNYEKDVFNQILSTFRFLE